MLQVCEQLGFPIAQTKIEGPTTVITFLGIHIDTIKMELRLPMEKLDDLLSLLKRWLRKRKATKRELLSI